MIGTLSLTVLIESAVIIAYAHWHNKPLAWLLLTGIFVNVPTQSLLWLALTALPTAYLPTLIIMEILIVGIEAGLLFLYKKNELSLREACLLSFLMNLASFGIGWFLKV